MLPPGLHDVVRTLLGAPQRVASADPSSPDFRLDLATLPHGLEDVRHILDLDRLWTAFWSVLALLVFWLLVVLWRRWRRRWRQRPTAPAAAPPPPAPPVVVPAIVEEIDRLRRRHLAAGTFRRGCHDLASLLRRFYEELWSEPVTTRTVREIEIVGERKAYLGDATPGRLFGRLEELQFGRRDPTVDDLMSVYDLAADVTSVSGAERRTGS